MKNVYACDAFTDLTLRCGLRRWLDGMPLVLCDDGSLRLLDAQMRTAAVSPMHSYRLPPSFFCTALYNFKVCVLRGGTQTN